mmetsp:Transcript_15635/g.31875  ORF Transcript_15635/g.31875 Transcript_15635/m.31875 type:complete len:200 (+) Transcript_15635:405-1004(+)
MHWINYLILLAIHTLLLLLRLLGCTVVHIILQMRLMLVPLLYSLRLFLPLILLTTFLLLLTQHILPLLHQPLFHHHYLLRNNLLLIIAHLMPMLQYHLLHHLQFLGLFGDDGVLLLRGEFVEVGEELLCHGSFLLLIHVPCWRRRCRNWVVGIAVGMFLLLLLQLLLPLASVHIIHAYLALHHVHLLLLWDHLPSLLLL